MAVLAFAAAACGGSSKKTATTTPGSATAGATKPATPGGAAASASGTKTSGTPAPTSAVATIVPVTVLANGTIVSGNGTPITVEQATAISAQATAVVAAATSIAATGGTPAATAPPGATATVAATAAVPPTLPPAGHGTIGFESTAPISAATGANFDVNLVVAGVTEPYQGYQWTIHGGPNVTVATQSPAPGSTYTTCATPSIVGQNLTYGGCVSTSDTATYNGRVATVTFHCNAPGKVTLRFANAIETNNFGTSFLRTGASGEFGGGAGDGLEVTCA